MPDADFGVRNESTMIPGTVHRGGPEGRLRGFRGGTFEHGRFVAEVRGNAQAVLETDVGPLPQNSARGKSP